MGELNNVCVMVCGRCRGDSRLQSYLLGTEIMADLTGQYGGAYQDHKERQADAAPIPPTEGDEMSKRCEVEEVWSDCHRTYCQQHKKCAVAAQSEPCQPLAAPIPPVVEPATEYAEYILDHYDRKSKKDRQLLGKHLAEWADRRYRDAAHIPPEVETFSGYRTGRISEDIAPMPHEPTPSQQEALNDLRELDTNFEFEGRMAVLRNHLHHFIRARPDEVTK